MENNVFHPPFATFRVAAPHPQPGYTFTPPMGILKGVTPLSRRRHSPSYYYSSLCAAYSRPVPANKGAAAVASLGLENR